MPRVGGRKDRGGCHVEWVSRLQTCGGWEGGGKGPLRFHDPRCSKRDLVCFLVSHLTSKRQPKRARTTGHMASITDSRGRRTFLRPFPHHPQKQSRPISPLTFEKESSNRARTTDHMALTADSRGENILLTVATLPKRGYTSF